MARVCFIGLGNPGAKYAGTRHNIGFDWLDRVSQSLAPKSRWKEKFESYWLQEDLFGHEIHFLKPQTFMNESGRAWANFRDKHQGDLRTIVVYDDLDLEVGRVRYRLDGGDGGHRGIRSMVQYAVNDEFERLRIGISRPPEDAADYVLSRFRPEERQSLDELFAEAPHHAELLLKDVSKAMNAINAWRKNEEKK